MKRFIETCVAIKTNAAMAFTGAIMLYVVLGWVLGYAAVPASFIWQALVLSLLAAVWQFVVFTNHVLKKMRYIWRALLFALPYYGVLSAFALGFGWFSLQWQSWLVFTGIFLGLLLLLWGVFAAYYRITGTRYDRLLKAYKSAGET